MAVTPVAAACSAGDLFTYDDRPLAERMEELGHRSEPDGGGRTAAGPDEPPEAIALADDTDEIEVAAPVLAPVPAGARMRSGPGSGYDVVVDVLAEGSVALSGNVTGEWTLVRYGDFEGWVMLRFLDMSGIEMPSAGRVEVDPDAPVVYVVAGAEIGVNMRAEPDAESELVSGAPVGSTVVGTGETDGQWVQVTFNDVTGWAFGGYLEPQ